MAVYARPGDVYTAILEEAPTGLTGQLGVRVEDGAGNILTSRTTAGIVEIAPTLYAKRDLVAPAQPAADLILWDAPAVWPGVTASETLVVLAAAHPLTEPALSRIPVYQGDDYLVADGKAFVFPDTANEWPSLVGATVQMQLKDGGPFDMDVIDLDVIQLELTRTQTAALSVKAHRYAAVATLADLNVVTLRTGLLVVSSRV